MGEVGKHKLSDAIPQPTPGVDGEGKPVPAHDTVAEKVRETHESAEAKNNQASIRDHMVDIGRGNQQAGRHGP